MSTDDTRERVTHFIRIHYDAHGSVPSIRRIQDDAHVNGRQFYSAFRGIVEACHLAGVPVPQARISQTTRANEADRWRPGHASTRALDEASTSALFDGQTRTQLGARNLPDALDIAVSTIRSLTPYTQHHRVRDPSQLIDQMEATHRQETAELRAALNTCRSRNAELQSTVVPFLDAFGDAFFSTWCYDMMVKFHAYMTSWGYEGSFVDSFKSLIVSRTRRVCAEEAKNLVAVEPHEHEAKAGATKPSTINATLFTFLWELKKQGLKESTINTYRRYLTTLINRGANLYDPSKGIIATQRWSDSTRYLAINVYSKFLEVNGGTWTPPKCKERCDDEKECGSEVGDGSEAIEVLWCHLTRRSSVRLPEP